MTYEIVGVASILVFVVALGWFTWWFVSHFVKVTALIVPTVKDNRRNFDRKVDRYTKVERARKKGQAVRRRAVPSYAVPRESVKQEPVLTSMDPDDDPLIKEDEDD